MAIRKMTFSDLDSAVGLYQYSNLFAKKKDIREWTVRGLRKSPDLNLVYEDDGVIIGAISAILKGKRIEINDIAVQEKYRDRNIGTKLMRRLMDILSKEKIAEISLWVHWPNAAAIPFYYKFGFRIIKCARTKNIFGVPDGEDIIYLEKII